MITARLLELVVHDTWKYNLNAIANYANAKGQSLEEVLSDLPRHIL